MRGTSSVPSMRSPRSQKRRSSRASSSRPTQAGPALRPRADDGLAWRRDFTWAVLRETFWWRLSYPPPALDRSAPPRTSSLADRRFERAEHCRLPTRTTHVLLAQQRDQVFLVDRLEQIIAGAEFNGLGNPVPSGVSGDENHLRPGVAPLGIAKHLQPYAAHQKRPPFAQIKRPTTWKEKVVVVKDCAV